MKKNVFNKIILVLATIIFSFSGCGGGGGGGEYIGAAIVSLSVSPSTIDAGGRIQVTTYISEVNDAGILLKFRYPTGLSYVKDSSILEVDGQKLDGSPDVSVTAGSYKYLVYFLSQSIFGRHKNGVMKFELRGDKEVVDGKIEVDADVDDPLIANPGEFDKSNPEFSAEDEETINVLN